MADAQATGTITNEDPLQAAWLARFGRAVAAETVDALGDRIERRAQARSESGDADLSLLTSFLTSSVGGHGEAGYGGIGQAARATALPATARTSSEAVTRTRGPAPRPAWPGRSTPPAPA